MAENLAIDLEQVVSNENRAETTASLISCLKDADIKWSNGDERVKNWIRQLRAIAYEAEDVIEDFNYITKRNNTRKGFTGATSREMVLLDITGRKVSILGLVLCFHLAVTTASTNLSLPDCSDNCGGISIPYPFGIEPDCYYNESDGFSLTCNESFNPPKVFLGDGTIEVINISLIKNTVHIKSKIMNSTSPKFNASWTGLPEDGPYTLSSKRNKFTAVGCGIFAQFISPGGFQDICASVCPPNDTKIVNLTCSGILCCQTPISADLRSFHVQLESIPDTEIPFWAKGLRSKAFAVDQEWLDVVNEEMLNSLVEVPAVLDWSMGNFSCPDAKAMSDYACRSHFSDCSNSSDGLGYVCNCSYGYKGNPYLDDGCIDINECDYPEDYPCYGVCINLPGGYSCVCPAGTIGDAKLGTCFKVKTNLSGIIIGLSSGLGFLLLLMGFVLIGCILKKRRTKRLREKFFKENRGLFLQQVISSNRDTAESIKIFNLEELEKATNNFDTTRIVGRGGHGTVYKGILSDQRVVAVKKSKILVQREIDEFINEVVILSQINHRNVVKLFGCCLETQVPLLVYEFISNGTLAEHLHADDGRRPLTWKDRLRIAIEAARALAYLHSAASISVFHRDIKSANILLDDAFTAKVSDFGASKSVQFDQKSVTTVIQGTFGYLDPEYYHTGQLSEKSDVYSFGIILVELLTGKRPGSTNYLPEAGSLAANFLFFMRENRIMEMLDPLILEEVKMVEEIKAMCSLAEMCLRLKGEERPTMREVEIQLEALRGRKKQLLHPWILQRLEESQSQQLIFPTHPSMDSSSSDPNTQHSLEEEYLLSSDFTG